MKVINLVIESVKRVKHVVITPSGWTVKIAGKNKQGKTSILDSLMFILEGEKNISADPRHAGEKKGRIDADFGDIQISRTFSEKGSSLTVTDQNGEVQKGQTFLNNLLGNNATDVMSFQTKTPAKQREILVKLTGADTAAIEKEIDMVFADRAKVNNEVERLQAILRSMKYVSEKGDVEVPAKDLIDKLTEIKKGNEKITRASEKKAALLDDIEKIKKQIETFTTLITEKQEEIQAVEMDLVGEDIADEAPVMQQLSSVEADNAIRRENKKYVQTRDALRIQEKAQEEKTEKLEKLRSAKIAMIAAAKFPIPGLSLGSDSVLFNGHSLQDASGVEQIMVGIAILSKIIPPDGIRILRCNNGSLIDDENMYKIEKLAEREQVQIWLELVRESQDDCSGNEIYIEDGKTIGQSISI